MSKVTKGLKERLGIPETQHRLFRVKGESRKFVGAGGVEFCQKLADELRAKPEWEGYAFVTEKHDGRDPK